MEHIECKFSRRHTNSNLEMKIGNNIIPQVTIFKYLDSITQNEGEIKGNINNRIQPRGSMWRSVSSVIYD